MKMLTKRGRTQNGFTLLELLLVMAILSSVIVLALNYATQRSLELRQQKVVMQIQQIENAALSYYVNNGKWPVTCGPSAGWTTIDTNMSDFVPNYVATTPINPFPASGSSPYYYAHCTDQSTTSGGSFAVLTNVTVPANAAIIAGQLPMAYTANSIQITSPNQLPAACNPVSGAGCGYVISSVNIPGQNLNNARSVNFAGIYKNGACVPAPQCPGDMVPQILVSVAGASGTNDAGTANVYPISSLTAYAQPNAAGPNANPQSLPVTNPGACNSARSTLPLPHDCQTDGAADALYWRVCLDVVTERGNIYQTNTGNGTQTSPGFNQYILALTRCAPKDEPSGSPLTVFWP